MSESSIHSFVDSNQIVIQNFSAHPSQSVQFQKGIQDDNQKDSQEQQQNIKKDDDFENNSIQEQLSPSFNSISVQTVSQEKQKIQDNINPLKKLRFKQAVSLIKNNNRVLQYRSLFKYFDSQCGQTYIIGFVILIIQIFHNRYSNVNCSNVIVSEKQQEDKAILCYDNYDKFITKLRDFIYQCIGLLTMLYYTFTESLSHHINLFIIKNFCYYLIF